jgi:hypothetical protein
MRNEALIQARHHTLQALWGHCAFLSPSHADLSPLQKIIIDYFARISRFLAVEGEHGGGYHKFDGFLSEDGTYVNKGLAIRGLRTLAKTYMFHPFDDRKYEDETLARRIDTMFRQTNARGTMAVDIFNSTLQLIAFQIVEERIRKDFNEPSSYDLVVDRLFGSQEKGDDIPF